MIVIVTNKLKYKNKKFNLCFYNRLKYYYKFIFWFFNLFYSQNYLLANYYYHDKYFDFLFKRTLLPLFEKNLFFNIPSYFNFFKKYYKFRKEYFSFFFGKFGNSNLFYNYYIWKIIVLLFTKLNILYKSNNYLFIITSLIFSKDFYNQFLNLNIIFKYFDFTYIKFFSFRKIISYSFLSNFVLTFKTNFFFSKFLRLLFFFSKNILKVLYFNYKLREII